MSSSNARESVAQALSDTVTALHTASGGLYIQEVQTDFEEGASLPAKSIWLKTVHAKQLRDFLNQRFPVEGENA